MLWCRTIDSEFTSSNQSKLVNTLTLPLKVIGNGVSVLALKPAEDGNGIILRICEIQGRHKTVTIESNNTAGKLNLVNILENEVFVDQETFFVNNEMSRYNVSLSPFEIKSFRWTRDKE